MTPMMQIFFRSISSALSVLSAVRDAGANALCCQPTEPGHTLSSFAMYEFAVTPAVTQLRRPGVTITEVSPGSVAEEIDLAPQDRIVRVNGRPVRDYLDFRFQTAGETELTFQVRKTTGETVEI